MRLLSLLLFLTVSLNTYAQENWQTLAEPHPFHGLASYLNLVNFHLVDAQGVSTLTQEEAASIPLESGQFLVASGRYLAQVTNSQSQQQQLNKQQLASIASELNQVRYAQLVWPLAQLAKTMEWLLLQIQQLTQFGWGLSLILFAFLIKALLYPASVYTSKLQASTAYTQAQLAPQIAAIKQQYKGEEAHNKIMAAHKELGVTPFYTLKPSLGFFIQIPVFIAIFNALAEMPQFAGQSFLWITDLSQPDALFSLGFTLPWFGSTFNLAPVLMALTAVVAALTYRLPHIDNNTLKAKRKQLIYMGLLFLVLFYPFPAAMTFYWLLANVLQLLEQNTRNYFLIGRKDD